MGTLDHLTLVIDDLVKADGFGELLLDLRICLFIEPADVIAADGKHAADSNRAVLEFFIDLSVDPAREQSVRAPGEYDYQERESDGLLERKPGTQAA